MSCTKCPKGWYTVDEIRRWLDRDRPPLTPEFLAEHFQKALEKGWQLRGDCGDETRIAELEAHLAAAKARIADLERLVEEQTGVYPSSERGS